VQICGGGGLFNFHCAGGLSYRPGGRENHPLGWLLLLLQLRRLIHFFGSASEQRQTNNAIQELG
jgi:hypothetical protein